MVTHYSLEAGNASTSVLLTAYLLKLNRWWLEFRSFCIWCENMTRLLSMIWILHGSSYMSSYLYHSWQSNADAFI